MNNISKPNIEEVKNAIVSRDAKDAKIDQKNRTELVSEGLQIIYPKKTIKIDTGEIIGIPNVVDLIVKQIRGSDRIISVEGESGCGKSSTAKMLAEKFGTSVISASDIFRYLTYTKQNDNSKEIKQIISDLGYQQDKDQLCLCNSQVNITKDLHKKLHTYEIDVEVAQVAEISQSEVIEFLNKEIKHLLASGDKKIIIEGRAFTLDFLPADLRIKLFADIVVRVERRLVQER